MMKLRRSIAGALAAVLVSTLTLAAQYPDNDVPVGGSPAYEAASDFAASQLEADGFFLFTGTDEGTDTDDAMEFLRANLVVETGRLKDTGAHVIKRMTKSSGPGSEFADPVLGSEVAEYFEVDSFPVTARSGQTFLNIYLRPMSPEKVLQYEREATGTANEQLADKADGMADAIGAMMDGLRSEGLPGLSADFVGSRFGNGANPTSDARLKLCDDYLSLAGRAARSEVPFHIDQVDAYIIGPECMLRLTADRLRKLDGITEEEKNQARQEASTRPDDSLGIVSADDNSVVIGMDIPQSPSIQGALRKAMGLEQLAANLRTLMPEERNPTTRLYRSGVSRSFMGAGVLGGLLNRNSPKQAPAAEPEITMSRIEVTIDRNTYKRTGMKMTGTMEQDGQIRPVVMDQVNGDFRAVASTAMYEPYRETTRVSGMVSPQQQAQMRTQLADLERQLAAMPPDRRAQMQQMMGGQMEQLRSMAQNGSIEIVRITTSIELDPELGKTNHGVAGGSFVNDETLAKITGTSGSAAGTSGGSGGGTLDTTGLVRMIQTSLVTLGYNQVAPSGQLDRPTVVAITQFEAAKGMPVTGQATPQLAGILAAEVDAQR